MSKKDKRELSSMFKALGDPTRLKIYLFLRGRCFPDVADSADEKWLENGPTVSEVSASVTGSKKVTSKVSQHLKELRLAGLVTIERRGKNMICGINQESVNLLVSLLNSTEAAEISVPELTVSAEPLAEPVAEVVTEPVADIADDHVETSAPKSRKKAEKQKVVEAPVVHVELVKSRSKSKATANGQDPPSSAV